MKPSPATATFAYVAAGARTALVLRRGPTRHTRMLRWNLRDDALTPGQWFVGRVYERACSLSPDGELFLYYARKGPNTFTALSRPPYFTALAFWPHNTFVTGGGFFASEHKLVLGVPFEDPYAHGDFPAGFEIVNVWQYFFPGRTFTGWGHVVRKAPEANQGWHFRTPEAYEKASPRHAHYRLERRAADGGVRYRVVQGDGARALRHDLGPVEWAEWDPAGDLLFGRDGCLYRQRLPASADGPPPAPPVLVADLRGQRFESVPPSEEARSFPRKRHGRGRRSR
jgi:hypothetical protein